MLATRDEIRQAALQLPEKDRVALVEELMETLPDEIPGLSLDDPGLEMELDRRAQNLEGLVAVDDLWKAE